MQLKGFCYGNANLSYLLEKDPRKRGYDIKNFNPSDRFQHEKRKFQGLFFILFRLNVAFNNLSVMDVTGSSMLTLRVLPH